MIIESKDNNIIKHCVQIKDKKYSQKFGECFVETEKVIKDLLINNFNVNSILISSNSVDKYKGFLENFKTENIFYINDKIAKILSDTTSNSDIFAVVEIPQNYEKIGGYLILDNIQDPSNFGAIIRSAVAFNFTNIIAIDSVYPYSFKTIRSSMANIFKINYQNLTYSELLKFLDEKKFKLVIADMFGEDIGLFKTTNKFALVIGNEGRGVSEQLKSVSDYKVSIPMKNDVESLNASVSAGILMFYLKQNLN